jgi:hypothetical protein
VNKIFIFFKQYDELVTQVIQHLSSIGNIKEVSVLKVTEIKQGDFQWGIILSACFVNDNACVEETVRKIESKLQSISNLTNNYALLYAGERKNGIEPPYGYFILSLYKWCSLPEQQRSLAFDEHFELEKAQDSYNSFAFNTVIMKQGLDADFVFESYSEESTQVLQLYSDKTEWLTKMRKHSEGFLNTNTRQLLIGKYDKQR